MRCIRNHSNHRIPADSGCWRGGLAIFADEGEDMLELAVHLDFGILAVGARHFDIPFVSWFDGWTVLYVWSLVQFFFVSGRNHCVMDYDCCKNLGATTGVQNEHSPRHLAERSIHHLFDCWHQNMELKWRTVVDVFVNSLLSDFERVWIFHPSENHFSKSARTNVIDSVMPHFRFLYVIAR